MLVATPISTHYRARQAALLAGKHVFVEKPLTSSVAQCADLTALAAERNLTLMVGHTFIYSPPVRKVKELIDSGELGEVRFVTMQRVNLGLHQKDVSVIWDLAAHDLSILDYWLGRDATAPSAPWAAIACATASPTSPSSTCSTAPAWWPGPRLLALPGQAAAHRGRRRAQDARLRRHRAGGEGQDLRPRRRVQGARVVRRVPDDLPHGRHRQPRGSTTRSRCGWRQSTSWHCVGNGHDPITDGAMGLRVVAALEAADASLREGVRKTVEPPRRPTDAGRRRRTLRRARRVQERTPLPELAADGGVQVAPGVTIGPRRRPAGALHRRQGATRARRRRAAAHHRRDAARSARSPRSTPAASSATACRPGKAPASAKTTSWPTTSPSAPTPCSSSATGSAAASASTPAASSRW